MTTACDADIDAAPDVACPGPKCQLTMPPTQIVCITCHANGHHGDRKDHQARNRRVTEILLWS